MCDWIKRRPFVFQMMARYGDSKILSGDATFKLAKKIKVQAPGTTTKEFVSPFSTVSILCNEYSEVVWLLSFVLGSGFGLVLCICLFIRAFVRYGCFRGKENQVDLKDHFQRLVTERKMPLKVYYTDTCCKQRGMINEVWGTDVVVLLDAFHWLARWEKTFALKTNDSLVKMFMTMMRNALFQVDGEDKAKWRAHLKKVRKTDLIPERDILKWCRRCIPPPNVLMERVTRVLLLFEDLNEQARRSPEGSPIAMVSKIVVFHW